MFRDIGINGKIIRFEFVIPKEVKAFLDKNNIDINSLLKDYKWEMCIEEDLQNENRSIRNNFENVKLIINYIHFSSNNEIRVSLENYKNLIFLISGNWIKGSFFKEFSIGYSMFDEKNK